MDPESIEPLPEPVEAPAEAPPVEALEPPPEPPAPAEPSVQELAELPPPEVPEPPPEMSAGPYEVQAQFVEPMVPDSVTVEFAELPPPEGQTLDTRLEDQAFQAQLEAAEETRARQEALDAVSDGMEQASQQLATEVGIAEQPPWMPQQEPGVDPVSAAALGASMAAALALKKN